MNNYAMNNRANIVIRTRVKYSIVINYLSHALKLVLSIIFTIILTRRLPIEEYGLWATILGVEGILLTLNNLWMWLNVRFYVRGKVDYLQTSFALTILYIPISVSIFMFIGLCYNNVLGWGLQYFIFASLLLVSDTIVFFYRSLSIAVRPYLIGYGNIVRDIARVLGIYILVYVLSFTLFGALMSVLLASIATCLLYVIYMLHIGLKIPSPRINTHYLKIVAKNIYIPLLAIMSWVIGGAEKPLVTAISSGTQLTAFINVSSIPRSIIVAGGTAFTYSIVSKLLSNPSRNDIEDLFRITFILNIGLTGLLAVMSQPVLSLFNPAYLVVVPLFLLYLLDSLFLVFAEIFGTVARALEKKDLFYAGLELMETPLFKIPLLRLLRCIFAIGLGCSWLYYSLSIGLYTPEVALLMFPVGWIIGDIIYLLYTVNESRKKISFSIPFREILASILGVLVCTLYLLATEAYKILVISFWASLPILTFHALISIMLYVSVVLAISKWFRELTLYILKNITNKLMFKRELK